MSRQNKVNPDHYTMAGRLTPDDLARERRQQNERRPGVRRGGKPVPPWMSATATAARARAADVAAPEDQVEEPAADVEPDDDTATRAEGLPRRRAAQKRGASAGAKGGRKTPRRKATGEAVGTARRKSTKASGASGTPKVKKAPRARASAARGSSPQRAGSPGASRGKTKGKGTTRKAQKKR